MCQLVYSLFSILHYMGLHSINQEMVMKKTFLKTPLENNFNFFSKLWGLAHLGVQVICQCLW